MPIAPTPSHLSQLRLASPLIGLLIGLLVGVSPMASMAQEASVPGLAAIETAREQVADATLSDSQRQSAQAELAAAEKFVREASALEERLIELRNSTAALPARARELEATLAENRESQLAAWRSRVAAMDEIESLELLLDQERAALAFLSRQRQAVSVRLAEALARSPQDNAERVAQQSRLEELGTPLQSNGEPAAVQDARRLRREGERQQLRLALELREAETSSAALWQRHHELELRAFRHLQSLHEARLKILQDAIADLGRRSLLDLVERLNGQLQDIGDQAGPVSRAAGVNAGIGARLLANHERLASERRSLTEAISARDRVASTLRDSQARLSLAGRSEQVGQWLWSERRRLESSRSLDQSLGRLRDRLGGLRLELLEASEARRELVEVGELARDLHQQAGALDEPDAGSVEQVARLESLLAERAALLDQLEPLLRRRISTLEQTELALQTQMENSLALEQILDRHLLWIPSHRPLDSAWLARIPEGVYDLIKPSRFQTSARLLAASAAEHPVRYAIGTLVVLALFWLRRRALPALTELAQALRSVRTDRYRFTGTALLWTLLAALPWPMAAWLLGDLLQGVGNVGRFSESLGRALMLISPILLAFAFLYHASIEQGLAHKHFRWPRARREALLRWMPPLTAVLLPLYFVVALAFVRNQDIAIDIQARGALVLVCLASALALWRMLVAGQVWSSRGDARETSLARKLSRGLLPLGLLVLAGLALTGYVYTSAILVKALLETVIVVIAVSVAHGLTARWLMLGERRLILRRLQKQQETAQSDAVAGGGESGEVALPDFDQDFNLEMIGAQSKRLLRALKLALLVAGLAWVWLDVLPAFSRLDEIALWHFSDLGAEGETVRLPVTLMAFLLGVLTLLLTAVAARNLPGLLEVGLLSRLRMDRAARYAATSLSRYAIVIVGVMIGLGLLGLRWSQLQWMAAALTVGLGFGLQEIFANFVSGLILLFERPFRVGDTITVGDLSGTVTRIRTRATTILDFDNKEIVVPNKSFITGQLINWTLSDTTLRLTVKVGVAYGSDIKKVHALLLKAAEEHPGVLTEPAPRSLFLNFGDSALEFEMRAFVGTVQERLDVVNELNGRIAELFADAGIEIAFPQMDIHVRHLPPTPPASPEASPP
jgi:potassium efflux system protein